MAASGNAILTAADDCFPGVLTYLSDRGLSPTESALGTGRRIWSVPPGTRPKARRPRARSLFCVCARYHQAYGRLRPLITVRKWQVGGRSGQTCARTFAGRIRPGSAAPTKTVMAFCDSTSQGASACTRSRRRALQGSSLAE